MLACVPDLCIRLWLTFAFHLPFFSRLNYLKYVMGFENAQLVTYSSALVAQMSSFYALRIVMKALQRYGKVHTLIYICSCACVVSTTFSLISPTTFKAWRLYCLQPIVEGCTQVALYTIPEWMLADVIDYDELTYGQRREGIFVVFDVNIMQLMDIVAGVLPGLILAAVGYRGNGSCTCGCGVKCPASYMRWSCPSDIGYACTSDLNDSNPPFMGPPDREPPCTFQQESVDRTLQLFFYAIPAGCFALATFFALRTPISTDVHKLIRDEIDRRALGYREFYDPVTGGVIRDDDRSQRDASMMHIVESFSQAEQVLIVSDDGVRRLTTRVAVNFAITMIGIVGLNVGMHALHWKKATAIVVFVSTLGILLLVWQGMKLTTVLQSAEVLKSFGNARRFSDQSFRSRVPKATSEMGHDFAHLTEQKKQQIHTQLLAWLEAARDTHSERESYPDREGGAANSVEFAVRGGNDDEETSAAAAPAASSFSSRSFRKERRVSKDDDDLDTSASFSQREPRDRRWKPGRDVLFAADDRKSVRKSVS